MSKSAAIVFARNKVEGEWTWGEHKLPRCIAIATNVGIDFSCNGTWVVHILVYRTLQLDLV